MTRVNTNLTFSLSLWQQAMASACCGDTRVVKTMLKNSNSSKQQDHQLKIYRHNFIGSRLNVLEQTFPLLQKLLGRDYLRQCGRHYISTNNSHYNCDLNKLGVDFPLYLQQLQHTKNELAAYPWLADLAQFDYLLHDIYYSDNDRTFDFNAFQQSSENLARLYFHYSNSIRLLQSNWPLTEISEDINKQQIQSHYPANKQNLCISRQHWKSNSQIVSSDAWQLLLGLHKGLSMQQLLTEIPNAQQLLPLFIQRGWICGFSLSKSKRPVFNDV